MPRIPEDVLTRIKHDVSLARLAEAAGVALKPSGKALRGLCPFHSEKTPSFTIDRETNTFRCYGCDAHGTPIDWVMRMNGLSFTHAVELLKADLPGLLDNAPARPLKVSTIRRLPAAVQLGASDLESLDQVAAFYHRRLFENPHALAYLETRGLADPETLAHFRIGFADRTLGLTLPEKSRDAGAELRKTLTRLGILREGTGHEHFRGCITVPLTDEHGHTRAVYGRRLAPAASRKAPASEREPIKHLYMPGPHRAVFNVAAIAASDELILCESPFDALTFWAAGFKNVTSSYGVNGFTRLHMEAFARHKTRRVLLAYDNDPAGNAATTKLAHELTASGIDCFRIQLPHGMDVNEYASKVKPATKSLELLIRSAHWLGTGPAPEREGRTAPAEPLPFAAESLATPAPPAPASPQDCHPSAPAEGALLPGSPESPASPEERWTPDAKPAVKEELPPPASPVPSPPPLTPPALTVAGDEVLLTRGDRTYRVRGLARNTSPEVLKVNLLVRSEDRFHVDTLDLHFAKARAAFEKSAALALGSSEQLIKADLGLLLLQLEELQAALLQKAKEPTETLAPMSEPARAAALALLRDPQLIARILGDFAACGIVGEETNKLVGTLATLSRKLPRPLALIVQSTSAAGKSTLMDALLDRVPDEERVQYSAMTGQALFYMGRTNLAHKVLAIAEEEGAERASYALKLLQSEGKLTIASTGKDPHSGRLVTHEYEVVGPAMIFFTTTALDVDEELLNRALLLTVGEDREQTRKIHDRQRESRTLDGLFASQAKADLLALHQNAQRLLQPHPVVNPFVKHLTFLDDKTRTRRDHEKYLTLIDTLALLHQYQRPLKTATRNGKSVTYIEATLDDIRLANRLADEVLGRSLDELPPQTRTLLGLLDGIVTQACEHLECARTEYRFTRRQIRESLGWSQTQLRVHLGRLEELEYLVSHRGGHGLTFAYELVYDGRGTEGRPFLPGLIDVDKLARAHGYDSNLAGSGAHLAGQTSDLAPPDCPQIGGVAGGDRARMNPLPESTSVIPEAKPAENALQPVSTKQDEPPKRAARRQPVAATQVTTVTPVTTAARVAKPAAPPARSAHPGNGSRHPAR